jgi:acyl-coenzyme A thioesterase PaaI-like protein
MKISEKALTWVMRLYPPLLFQRIWVRSFEPGFSGVDVVIVKSFMNKNYNKSIFGGTIFTATDPFYAILFDQVLQRRGLKCRVWLKSAQINYLKPGRTNLSFRIQLSESAIKEAEEVLHTQGKFVKSFPIDLYDTNGVLCASVQNEVYIRNLHKGEADIVAY